MKKTVPVSIRIPVEAKNEFQLIADEKGITLTEHLRDVIVSHQSGSVVKSGLSDIEAIKKTTEESVENVKIASSELMNEMIAITEQSKRFSEKFGAVRWDMTQLAIVSSFITSIVFSIFFTAIFYFLIK